MHQATVLLHRTRNCTPEVARAVEARVLPEGAALVPSDLTRRVDRAVLQAESEQRDAAAAEQRHADAAAQRRTFAKATEDGMGLAGAVLTAEQLVGWQTGLDALERRERVADRDAGVDRTAEQRRADLFAALPAMVLAGTAQDRADLAQAELIHADLARADLAEADLVDAAGPPPSGGPGAAATSSAAASPSPSGAAAPGVRPWTFGPEQLAAQIVVNVHVPVATVLGLSRAPGTMDRYGPVSAEHVRLLRPRSWRRVLVGADSGRPVAVDDRATPAVDDPERARQQVLAMLTPEVVTDVDEPQHDPSARLARLIHVRDVHCCGPGCSSTRTHNDHLEPYPDGPTSAANLGRLSPRCHRAEHGGWTLVRHPDGSVTWTSPLGRSYDRPPPHSPPPHVDLDAPLPPLRARPEPATVEDGEPEAADRTGDRPAPTPLGDDVGSEDPDDDPPPF